ncbi:MAG: hypothetical protein AAGD05_10145 [Bacteroidota bacterium]
MAPLYWLRKNAWSIGLPLGIVLLLISLGRQHEMRMEQRSSDFQFQTATLQLAFKQNQGQATTRFTDKVLEVIGHLKQVNLTEKKHLILTLSSEDQLDRILCQMRKPNRQIIKEIEIGSMVKIKGICQGKKPERDGILLTDCILL